MVSAPNRIAVNESADIFSRISLPCGRSVRNRLVKVATYEHLGNTPNPYHFALYSEWAQNDWGMIITGNVQVSPTHLSLGYDMIVPRTITQETLKAFKRLSGVIHNFSHPTLAIMQLSHAGRQSPNMLGGRFPFVPPLSASAIRLGSSLHAIGGSSETSKVKRSVISNIFYRLLFQRPREMTPLDIEATIQEFVHGAHFAVKSGFDGIQLHAAHGYLLAQFLSPESNLRQDEFSCAPEHALHLLRRIVFSIREAVPPNFIVGLKINAADYAQSKIGRSSTSDHGIDEERRILDHVMTIARWGLVDFIEISGGDYENPDFMSVRPFPESRRQALFARFSYQALKAIQSLPLPPGSHPLVLLTGGLRTPSHLRNALAYRHAQLLGIARGSILCPHLPQLLQQSQENAFHKSDDDFEHQSFAPEPRIQSGRSIFKRCIYSWTSNIRLVGAGMGMAWYIVAMRRLAIARIQKYGNVAEVSVKQSHHETTAVDCSMDMDGVDAVIRMWVWIGVDHRVWAHFGILLLALFVAYYLS
ncbi:hypothetical protein SERLADRAFT_365771 [Serpula lacrymans var. lacrymans S7.9]|uniref:NADH:flavin oxidoreductase/NADH oxidase N-terminal domain-containing protein n=1 Tax=Serpula lacrymans var. lacrymans (strain S7.9) TaxID=578457 RepID=F8NIJ8_SERL9|nr:uncharacterized protein SERLADRAFT_365771 [Serpula lacrymans var. lacrymans S7.9]EGO29760.1 hypothetical protein SERLADRAFT_365771 [Serpula lacrymans var. lacrymans S7.9]